MAVGARGAKCARVFRLVLATWAGRTLRGANVRHVAGPADDALGASFGILARGASRASATDVSRDFAGSARDAFPAAGGRIPTSTAVSATGRAGLRSSACTALLAKLALFQVLEPTESALCAPRALRKGAVARTADEALGTNVAGILSGRAHLANVAGIVRLEAATRAIGAFRRPCVGGPTSTAQVAHCAVVGVVVPYRTDLAIAALLRRDLASWTMRARTAFWGCVPTCSANCARGRSAVGCGSCTADLTRLAS